MTTSFCKQLGNEIARRLLPRLHTKFTFRFSAVKRFWRVQYTLTPNRRAAIMVAAMISVILAYYCTEILRAYRNTPSIVSRALVRDRVLLSHLSEERLHILLSVEDPTFFSHCGVDFNTPGAGATTITQALVKLHYFHRFRPGIAKIKQTLIALTIDRLIPKHRQLDMYINTAYFGRQNGVAVYGMRDAAQVYFQKDFVALSRRQYIELVAMLIGPDEFNVASAPHKNRLRSDRIERLLNGLCAPANNRDVYYDRCA